MSTEATSVKYRHTIVLEFDTPESERQYSASMKAMGGSVVAVSFNDALDELEKLTAALRTVREDRASLEDDLRDCQSALRDVRKSAAQAIELYKDARDISNRGLGLLLDIPTA